MAVSVVLAPAGPTSAQDELPPRGVVAHYSWRGLRHVRLEPRPAFYLDEAQAPAPDFGTGKWTGHWIGLIDIVRPGRYRFSARIRGRLRLRIGEQEVLSGQGEGNDSMLLGPWVRLKADLLPFLLYYDAPSAGPARLQLWWQSEEFLPEPLPSRVLRHRPEQEGKVLARWQLIERGRGIARALQCAACHGQQDADRLFAAAEPIGAPDLSGIGSRLKADWLSAWLKEPQKLRPDTWMPALLPQDRTGELARAALVAYLSSLKEKLPKPKAVSEERRKQLVDAGRQLFELVGCAVCHRAAGRRPPLYRLTYMAAKASPRSIARFLLDPLRYHPSGRMPRVKLSEDEALALAHYVCSDEFDEGDLHPDLPSASPQELAEAVRALGGSPDITQQVAAERDPRAALIAAGRELIQVVGCLACHRLSEQGRPLRNRMAAPRLGAVSAQQLTARGCIAGRGRRIARYRLDPTERDALVAFLTRTLPETPPAEAPTHRVPQLLRFYGCVRCHEWHGNGGLAPEFVDRLRQRFGADHAEAVTPPPLTATGEKLRTEWLTAVLLQHRRVRPWMPLRMPDFGRQAVGRLARWLAAFDGVAPGETGDPKLTPSPERIEAGRFLVGKGGYGCISCHDMLGRYGEGTRGPELSTVTQRIRYPWFVRWLRDAQRIIPGTRMPTIFPNDTTQIRTVLGGDGRKQLDAIWAYLSLGNRAPLPEGLLPPQGLVIEVKDRPYLLRTFMPETSTRAIAVGFPSQVSYAFDAARGRLAYAWSGGFLDATPVWANRGGNPAIPVGSRFWQHVAQFPWYFVTDARPPDWARLRADPCFADPLPPTSLPPEPRRVWFRGYRLDQAGQPTFLVEFDAYDGTRVQLEQTPRGVQDAAGPGLVVALRAQARRVGTLWWLLGETTEQPRLIRSDGTGATGPDDAVAALLQSPTGTVLVVLQGAKLHTRRGTERWLAECALELGPQRPAKVTVGYWAPYTDEPQSIKRLIAATASAADAAPREKGQ